MNSRPTDDDLLSDAWLDSGLLGRVRRIVRPWDCHLVGGAVRDRLLGLPPHDLDLVVDSEDPALALAAELPAKLVPIGGDRFAASRLVSEEGVIDLWDRQDMPLEAELARRDLSINAMAIDLAEGILHDPWGGHADLGRRRLRATSEASFTDDALRVLRLARFAAQFPAFEVDTATLELAAEALPRLASVASERRREEFARSLTAAVPERALDVWVRIGFYPALLGEAPAAAAATAKRYFTRAQRLQDELSQASHAGDSVMVEPLAVLPALLLAAATADIARLVDDGYVSRRQARDISLVVPHTSLPPLETEQRWLLHRAGHCWPAALCFAASLAEDLDEGEVTQRLAEAVKLALTLGDEVFNPTPLLRGDEIRELLGLPAGPEVGFAARRLRRQQVEGRLVIRETAERWLLSELRSSDAD